MPVSELIYENVFILMFSLSIIFWTSWLFWEIICEKQALNLAIKLHGDNGKSNIRRMGLLSELWQIMYETNNSPIIHAFEYGPNSGYHFLTEFWSSFSKKYVNFRSIPIKVNKRWFWKEIEIRDYNKFIQTQCKQIKLETINGSTEKAVAKFVNDLNMNKPFNKNKPYWEAYYISFTDNKSAAYGYGRLHHSIGDGVLMSKLFQMEHDTLWSNKNKQQQQQKEIKLKTTKTIKRKKKSMLNMIYNLFKYLPWTIMDLILFFWIESAPLKCGIHCDYYDKDNYEFNIKRKFNISISNKFLLNKIKKKCKSLNIDYTINDFVMTMFCEAVYEYIFKYICNENKEKYDKMIVNQYGNKFYLRFFTIFNMRSLMNNNLEKLSASFASDVSENAISTVPIKLPCGNIPFNQRINEVHSLFHKLKNGPMPIITSLILQIGHILFGLKFVNAILGKYSASKCTFLLSNLMGPKQPLLSGKENKNKNNKSDYVWNVFNGTNPTYTPLSCGIMSYVDYITFTMIADQNAINDPNQFIKCLNNVYDKLIEQ